MPRAPSVPPEIEEKIISRWDNRDTMKGLADEFKLELRQVTYLINVKRWRKRKKERNKNCINGEAVPQKPLDKPRPTFHVNHPLRMDIDIETLAKELNSQ